VQLRGYNLILKKILLLNEKITSIVGDTNVGDKTYLIKRENHLHFQNKNYFNK